MNSGRPASARHSVSVPALLVALALLAAACSSAGANSSSSASSTPSTSIPFQGAIGQVAALTPPSMEVQNPQSGQTTVSWTSSTKFDQTVSVPASSIAAGDCVVVSGTPATAGSSSSPITARSVSIQAPSSNGTCSAPAGNGGFQFSRAGGGRAFGSGGPTRASIPANGSPPGGFPRLATVLGKVSDTNGAGFVVHGVERGTFRFRSGSAASSSTTTTTAPPATEITVTTTSSTSVTQQQSASASDLSMGSCVTALGPSDSTGAVAATSISIRQATNGTCFGGFGPGGGGGGIVNSGPGGSSVSANA